MAFSNIDVESSAISYNWQADRQLHGSFKNQQEQAY